MCSRWNFLKKRRRWQCLLGSLHQPPHITGKWPSANPTDTVAWTSLDFLNILIGFSPESTHWISHLHKNPQPSTSSKENCYGQGQVSGELYSDKQLAANTHRSSDWMYQLKQGHRLVHYEHIHLIISVFSVM